jgi:hypothetical protein
LHSSLALKLNATGGWVGSVFRSVKPGNLISHRSLPDRTHNRTKIYHHSNKREGMKYLLFILLLVAVLITAGCVSENKNTINTPTQTTPAPTIIVTTIVPTTIVTNVPSDSAVGSWRYTFSTGSWTIFTFNQDGTYKHTPFRENGEPTGENYFGTWRKVSTNQYVTADSRFVGKTDEYTKGLTGESIYPWIYHPETDTMTRDIIINTLTFYRNNNVPSPSPSGQTQSGVTQLSGFGDDVQFFTATGSGLRIFTMSHTGSHNFAVVLKDGDGKYVTLLANEIGSYSGKKSERLTSGTYYLDITADGSWTIHISSM